MASADFHGPIPHRRCETCTHWARVKPAAYVGGCHNDQNTDDLNPSIRRVIAFTTDLQLCSGWKPKEE